jgi:hypothetical protein
MVEPNISAGSENAGGPSCYSTTDFRKRAGNISASLFWRLVREGKIPTIKLGRRTLVPRSAANRILTEGL